MSRLNWGAAGERLYESGIDRGVLYVDPNRGVAWNGLTAVAESPSGGDPRPYYLDGVKYLNVASAEEFEAMLTAYYCPPEFGPCDGVVGIHTGLFATQQPRKSFGLSYRTMVGNDLEGTAYGYKIHLVYNALAAPSSRANSTVTASSEAETFSWAISTLPPAVTGVKRTAHFVIESRSTAPATLSKVENLLYGSNMNEPTLPTPDELIAIFNGG